MKLIRTHLIPGGAVKVYDDNTANVLAKYHVQLLAEKASEAAALYKLAADMQLIASAIEAKADELSAESFKKAIHLKVASNSKSLDERRKEFLATRKKDQEDDGETETENPYGTEAS